MVTRLYAYGSYGDVATGYCGIDELKHTEWVYVIENAQAGNEYSFTYQDAMNNDIVRYFTAGTHINPTVVYSNFDPASMMYVWDGSRAYKVYSEPKTNNPIPLNLSEKKERLITNEINSNNELINLNLQSYLVPRQKAAEQFNKLFGTNVEVKVRSDLYNIIKQQESVVADYNGDGLITEEDMEMKDE